MPETIFDNFAFLTDAPNGIQKLRELILQLAVHGKLVPQNPDEESSSILLGKIQTEKNRSGRETRSKRLDSQLSVGTNEAPSDLPMN